MGKKIWVLIWISSLFFVRNVFCDKSLGNDFTFQKSDFYFWNSLVILIRRILNILFENWLFIFTSTQMWVLGRLTRRVEKKHCCVAVPDIAAPIWWAWPEEIEQTLCGRWESDPQAAERSAHKASRDQFEGVVTVYAFTKVVFTLIAASSCSASCSIPKNRASSRTPAGYLRWYVFTVRANLLKNNSPQNCVMTWKSSSNITAFC